MINRKRKRAILKARKQLEYSYNNWEDTHCAECGKKWHKNENGYFDRFGTCDESCYMSMIGMSYRDFY